MAREFEEIEDGGQALDWATGALLTACRERGLPLLIVGGRTTVALLTLAYAAFHMTMAANGLKMLLGAPDWYHDKLLAWGHPEAAAARIAALPWIVAWQAAMGLTHGSAAIFLACWRPRPFFSLAIMAALSTAIVDLPSGWFYVFGGGKAWGWWLGTTLALMLIAAGTIFARLERNARRYA